MLFSRLTALLKKPLTVNHAKQIHAQILRNHVHELEPLLIHQLFSSACSSTPNSFYYVQRILLLLQEPDSFCWSRCIYYFAHHGRFKGALSLYAQMQRLGLPPSTFSVSSALKACARLGYKIGGVSIHGQVHKYEILCGVHVQTSLLDFYSKMGNMESAQKVFDEMSERNVVSWNSMLSGYLKYGDLASAKHLFDVMPTKDVISWNTMISGYARSGDMNEAHLLFVQMPEKNLASWNSVMSGYIDCGKLDHARRCFDTMPQKNSISWAIMISGYSKAGDVESARNLFDLLQDKEQLAYNSMIACYAQTGWPSKAIQLFDEMLKSKALPDKMTFSCAISACSQLGDLRLGSWIESCVQRFGIEMDDHLATALIDLYAKCGNVDKAHKLFMGLDTKDVVAYTAMILGWGLNNPDIAIKLFHEMLYAGVCPNLITFSGILTAYNHAGFVEEGYDCFNSIKKHGLVPSGDHYAIMVDMLGRAGRLKEAYDLVKGMTIKPHAGVWGALLLACRLHNNVELGEIAARHCCDLEQDITGYSSGLANIYASRGRWDDARSLRMTVNHNGPIKAPGYSWIDSI
ncbi:hypothetical protein Droror1_Dr00005332 [Drosera rotundifolia]